MSISSSLNVGVMGLGVNSTRLATISDNIANSATNGYKRSEVDFASLVTPRGGTAYSAGGVQVSTFKNIAEVGGLISTGNSTDLAVSGRGLLPVTNFQGVNEGTGQRPLMLTPTGSFSADENGNLRTPSGLYLLGWPTDPNGEVGNVSRNSAADLSPVNIASLQFTASPTTRIDLGINLPADATAAGSPGDSVRLPIEYFDTLGRTQNLSLQFSPVVPADGASNAWQLQVFDEAGDPAVPVGVADLVFSDQTGTGGFLDTVTASNGAVYDPATGRIALNLAHGPVDLFIGTPGDQSGLSQFSAPFTPTAVTKDGTPIGDLQSVEIDESGFLQAIYDTGFRRSLYQIPVGDVPNLNGLEALDGQALAVSATSGDLFLWNAGDGPVGGVSGFALMQSTTDIASELTDLIETQRAYSSNATIIQTVDEMLQETTNLKR